MPELTKNHVYSFGYSGQKFDAFCVDVVARDLVVIDTRFKPYSRDPTWNKSRLLVALGVRYRWIEALGNINYKGGPISIKDLELGLRLVHAALAERSVVLLCVCKDVSVCHRNVVLGRLRDDGFMTMEWSSVEPPKPKRASLPF